MVSFQNSTPHSPKQKGAIVQGLESLSKKRKWEETQLRRGRRQEEAKEPFWKRSSPLSETTEAKSAVLDIELHLETPLPSEWQRYLDVQSGQIHFYNTRTHERTSEDPRETSDKGHPTHLSLDLELNLPYNHDQQDNHEDSLSRTMLDSGNLSEKKSGRRVKKVQSWLGLETRNETEGEAEEEEEEADKEEEEAEAEEEDHMVATVCARCHMLVMLCKSSPTCPNCKFLHPPDQNHPALLKGRCSLLC